MVWGGAWGLDYVYLYRYFICVFGKGLEYFWAWNSGVIVKLFGFGRVSEIWTVGVGGLLFIEDFELRCLGRICYRRWFLVLV